MFDSSRLKIVRAKKHIADLEDAFKRFVALQPYTMAIQNHSQGGMEVRLTLTKPMPNELGLIIGDAIHNLRTALDHATWEIIGIDGGIQDRHTKLPVSSSGTVDYVASCRGMRTPREDTKQFFIDLAVHNESGSPLYALHLMDNTDKHVVLLPILAAAKLTYLRIVKPDGSTMVEMRDTALAHAADGAARINIGAGLTIETNNETQVVPAILFDKGNPLTMEPVIPTLTSLAEQVSIAVEAFDQFVRTRNPDG